MFLIRELLWKCAWRQSSVRDAYVIFVSNSDIDFEHGVAVLCKNGVDFIVTHSDFAYTNHNWDDTAEFEQLLGK